MTTTSETIKTKAKKDQYHPGIGRRKRATAQVRIYERAPKKGEESIEVNGKACDTYFPTIDFRMQAKQALELTGLFDKVRVTCRVRGGGMRGQSEAIRLGIARALVVMDEGLKPTLKSAKLLTRDDRKVERKKPGLKKARRAPQWSKR